MIHRRASAALAGILLSLLLPGAALGAPLCLYVSSYHAGYHWNDGIEAGLARTLGERCELRRFYLDTQRHQEPEFAVAKAAEAKALIDELRPQVVIACDDSASRYLVVPHLKDTTIPVVFCGVNWTVEPYGYPFPNVTGMIEVAPIGPLLREARALLPEARTLAFLAADVPTQHKELARLAQEAKTEGLTLQPYLVGDLPQWERAFEEAQQADMVVLGNPSGIRAWDAEAAARRIAEGTHRLTLSFGVAMSRQAVFAMTNVPEEQGEWSGELAKLILDGHAPAELPITANRRWQMFANPELARQVGIRLPERILQNALLPVAEGR
jgi:ABC-type uncharacterized transport system substrate-binding protein